MPVITDAEATESPPWLRVEKGALAGELPAVPSGARSGLPARYFREIEPPADRKSLLAHSGGIESLIFQTTNSATRSFDYPGDQVVRVLSGTITFIDEPSGRIQTFELGDYFVVPRHWRGIWILKNLGVQPARIFVNVEAAVWSAARTSQAVAPVSATAAPPSVIRVDLEEARSRVSAMDFKAPGSRPNVETSTFGNVVFSGDVSLLLLESPTGTSYGRTTARCESTVRVISGSIVLEDERGTSETFTPEDVFILTRSFRGTLRMAPAFSAVSVVTAARDDPGARPINTPSVNLCPAM